MIIWCASYPKSGNTWVRAILTTLLHSKDGIFNFNLLKEVSQFPLRHQFKNFTKDYSNLKKISQYSIKAQEKINSDGKLRIFKTHNGNYNFLGNDFTNKKNTLGVIYIVRDPRTIATSISNHYMLNMEESVNFMLNEKKTIFSTIKSDETEENIINLLCSWKDHYNSWKIASNLILIKYEDLLNDTKSQIDRLSLFLKKFGKFESSDKKINNIIKTTAFEILKKKEENEGFEEAHSEMKFFNLGPKNIWKDVLNEKLTYRIEKNFKKEMKELNYLS